MAKHSRTKQPKHMNANGKAADSQRVDDAAGDSSNEARGSASRESGAGENARAAAGPEEEERAEVSDSADISDDAEIATDAESAGEIAVEGPDGRSEADGSEKSTEADKDAETGKADEAGKTDTADKTDVPADASSVEASEASEAEPAETAPAKGGKHAAPENAADGNKKKPIRGKKSKGKHGAHAQDKREQPIIQSVPMPAASAQESQDRAAKRKKRLRHAGIGVGFAAALCLIAYLGGALFFATHYLPNTQVAGIDISLKTPEEMESLLNDSVEEYSLKVIGNGLNFTVTSDEADISADSAVAADAVLKTTNIWAWPVLVFNDHDLTSELSSAISAEKLSDVVKVEVDKINKSENATLPTDAHVAYNAKTHEFEVVGETMGTTLNLDEVMNQVVTGVINLQPKVTILSDALVQPNVFSNDKRLSEAADKANDMVKANVEVTMEGFMVTKVNPDVSSKWVTFTPEIDAVFSDDALAAWAEEVASMCNTVGAERTYIRPDGKQITVSGGVYGWEIDNTGLAQQIIEAVRSGKNATIEIPVVQSGTGFNGLGGQDWGNRYVDVDLSEQYARFYGDDGGIIWEAPIVSGKPSNGHATPQGVWWVNRKASPSKLIGEMKDGKPEYETMVQYWMPFQGNAIGFHDATWQPYFGGSLYLSNGSHGCINLSYSAAESLYGILGEGDVVVVHY